MASSNSNLGASTPSPEWIYEPSIDGTARFTLGTAGLNPLVWFGINPSTAVPNALDRTVNRVSKFALANGYDSWTMLNVYPQIATDPRNLHLQYRPDLKAENELHIGRVMKNRPRTIVAAWGDLIESRPYLAPLLRDIFQLTSAANCKWVSVGDLTKRGNPRHPLYRRGDTPLLHFDMDRYLNRPLRSGFTGEIVPKA